MHFGWFLLCLLLFLFKGVLWFLLDCILFLYLFQLLFLFDSSLLLLDPLQSIFQKVPTSFMRILTSCLPIIDGPIFLLYFIDSLVTNFNL